jgi:Uma2 family endonuclease
MAIGTRATKPEIVPYRLSVTQFEAMVDADIIPEGRHVELLDEMLVDKMTKHRPHSIAAGQARDLLAAIVPGGWHVDHKEPIQISRYDQPEPDVFIVRGQRRDYPKRPPGPKDLALIVEVSDVTYAKDRGAKWRLYAVGRVVTYWIIRLSTRQIEVYTRPAGRGADAFYRDCQLFGENDTVPVMIEGREVGRLTVREVLP